MEGERRGKEEEEKDERERGRELGGGSRKKEEEEKEVVTCKRFQVGIHTCDDCGLNQNWGSKPRVCGDLHQLLPLQGPRQTLTCVQGKKRSHPEKLL